MNKIRLFFIAMSLGGMLLGAHVNAQTVNLDLSKISPNVGQQVLTEIQKLKEKEEAAKAKDVPAVAVPTVTQARQWADAGVDLANAVGATAHALSMEANDFVKTPVGWWAFAFIFWYFLGTKLWTIFGGAIIWAILGTVLWHSFSVFHRMRRQIISQEGKTKNYEYKKYEFKTESAKTTSAVAHVVAFVLLAIIMLCKIL